MEKPRLSITDVPGIRVGHCSNYEGMTGCSVVLCPEGTVGSVDIRGSATGTRQIDGLFHRHAVPSLNAVMIAGGSAFGLDAGGGAMRYLEERKIGFDVVVTRVPIVPTAILFDLAFGRSDVRPTTEMGYEACANASEDVPMGSVGAGTGATIGKFFGVAQATKGGLGAYSLRIPPDVTVGALVAVNSFGDVRDPLSGRILAGARKSSDSTEFVDTRACYLSGLQRKGFAHISNTTVGVVCTDARLTKIEAAQVARMAQNGLAKVISPVHTPFDGDIVFVLSTGTREADVSALGLAAETALAHAVLRAVGAAHGLGLLPASSDLGSLPPATA